MNKSFYIVGALIAFLIGLYLGWFLAYGQVNAKEGGSSYDKGYQAGIDYARTQLNKGGILTMVESLSTVEATLKAVNTSDIVIMWANDDLLSGNEIIEKTIRVTDQTRVEKRTNKAEDIYQAEMSQYEKEMTAYLRANDPNQAVPVLPELTVSEAISIDQLSVGSYVQVDVQGNLLSDQEVLDGVFIQQQSL